MVITREQQQALVDNYIKAGKTLDEIMGFIDGLRSMLELIEKLSKTK